MSDATSTQRSAPAFARPNQPEGFFQRIGAMLSAVAHALAEAQAMRRDAKGRFPHLSDDF